MSIPRDLGQFGQIPESGVKGMMRLTSVYRCIKMLIVRTTVTLDRDVYEAALHLSRTSGKRLGKVLSELARRGLKPEMPGRIRKKSRFPVFEVPEDAPIIPASRIQESIDEEGLF